MILELDAGNSRVKWRIVDAAGVSVTSGTVSPVAALETLAQPAQPITRVRLACVAGAANEQAIAEWTRHRLDVEPEIARTQLKHNGLQVAYQDPQRLGVDRWLAMLAAKHDTTAPVCVIDCGSAVTVDLVAAGGRHLGGYIVPGMRLQRSALLRDTGQVQMTEAASEEEIAWGRSTEEAVNHGINRMMLGLVESVLAELADSMPDVEIYFTGGDAATMMQHIKSDLPCREQPELVLDGLALALP